MKPMFGNYSSDDEMAARPPVNADSTPPRTPLPKDGTQPIVSPSVGAHASRADVKQDQKTAMP